MDPSTDPVCRGGGAARKIRGNVAGLKRGPGHVEWFRILYWEARTKAQVCPPMMLRLTEAPRQPFRGRGVSG